MSISRNDALSSMEVHVDNLAEFLFLKNVNDLYIDMSFQGEEIKTTKDLFYFFLDLFCKGLVLTFGDGTNMVDISCLGAEQFAVINKKMQNAGIEVKLHVEQRAHTVVDDSNNTEGVAVNFPELNNLPDNKPLSEYSFKIVLPYGVTYVVSFDLIYNTVQHHCNKKHTFNN